MKKLLRNLIEEDIDKVIDNKKINNKNFFFLILHYLLDNKKLDLVEINEMAFELCDEYNKFLNDFDLELMNSNGEIIKVLKSALPKFNKRIAHILSKIDEIKENGNS
jgi:hypothetical protein